VTKMTFRRIGEIFGAASLICVLVIGALSQASFAMRLENASCGKSRSARDFLAPLEKMQAIHRLPASGKLPFGPAGFNVTAGERLIVGRGAAGFDFSDEAIEQRRNVGWRLAATLYRVSGTGKPVSRVARIERRLGMVEGSQLKPLLLFVSGVPALYRADLKIWKAGTNRLLGSYSEYYRGMRPSKDVRLTIEEPNVAPGDTARARLVNFGTLPIESSSYTFGVSVRHLDGSRWVPVAESPPRGPVVKRMQILEPGMEARGCLRYLVPEDEPPGKYRFQGEGLVADFEVVSP
jgi:hypothetical protein